ncbi:MAG: alpha-amylase family glycosyl hydrolase [Planctomycetota bacterium]|nr:alpha-amylase family glycosyl hydrolase [Planctomycetota bacterium]MDP6940900.1 alpha-amylase family glycosyl hydrolase [Planctomycetota bacterium]
MFAISALLLFTQWPPFEPLQDRGADSEVALAVPGSIQADALPENRWRCEFSFDPGRPVESVFLVGSFNAWSKDALPMERTLGLSWRVVLELPPGLHHYKFVVNGEEWKHDPLNSDHSDDGHGGRNSILRLGLSAVLRESHEKVGDGNIRAGGLDHNPANTFFLQRLSDGSFLIRYQSLAHDLKSVTLALRHRNNRVRLSKIHQDERFQIWEARIGSRIEGEYTFLLEDGDTIVSHPEVFNLDPQSVAQTRTPAWTKDAIWYQIMPDRFRNGNADWNPSPVNRWTAPYEIPEAWEEKGDTSYWEYSVFQRQYGGDLAGLEEKLPYLADLGVNALYLNPVFEATSHHKYNATNYLHIDDRLGGGGYAEAELKEDLLDPTTWTWTESDRRFLRFLKKAKSMGFRVIIDGVLNHVGVAHPAFRDVQENGKDSRFADWFSIRSWEPFEYEGWAGFGELPVFAKNEEYGLASESLRKHIFAMTARWMDPDGDGDPSDGIDGWRLDVPNEVPMAFWDEWCRLVHTINPDAYISGEIWHRAEEWVKPGRFDAVMNYPFAQSVVAWIGHKERRPSTSELSNQLAELRLAYSAETTFSMQNLLDSHDTDRLASMMQNPDRDYDQQNRLQDSGPNYDDSRPSEEAYRRARLGALFQMTWMGAPMIWAGDEVGVWGADDPMCRRPMLWKDLEPFDDKSQYFVDENQLEWYRKIIHIRSDHSALRRGSLEVLLTDDERDLFVFSRIDQSESIIVALNAGPKAAKWNPNVDLRGSSVGKSWKCILGEEEQVPAIGGSVWVRSK